MVNGCVSLYSKSLLIAFLNSKTVFEILDIFSHYINKDHIFILESMFDDNGNNINKISNLVYIVPKNNNNVDYHEYINFRKKRINRISNLGCKYIERFKFIPEDFHNTEKCNNDYEEMTIKFQLVEMILSLLFLSNTYEINKNILTLKFNSKITKKLTLNLEKIYYDNDYFEIYAWISEKNNNLEKLLLSREIINSKLNDSHSLSNTTVLLESIISNYIIYERGNIEAYIKIKNEIVELIEKLNNEVELLFSNLIDNILKSIASLIMIYVATFLPKFISVDMSNDLKYLEFVMISFTFIYMMLISYQSIYKLDLLRNQYCKYKEMHSDLLSESDLSKLFDLNYFNALIDNTNKKIKMVSFSWLIIVILFIIFIHILKTL